MNKNERDSWSGENAQVIWEDKMRIFGMPISFTKYQLTDEKLVINEGFLNLSRRQIQLYRMKDFSATQSLGDRIFGVGDIKIISTDPQDPTFVIRKIKNPWQVLEILNEAVQIAYEETGVRPSELYISR